MRQFDRFGHMQHEALLARVRETLARRDERLSALRTRQDAEDYVRRVRRSVRQAFGPFPTRTPLNARVTGREPGDRYDIERLLYESRPGNLVSANLYRPAVCRLGGRHPAALVLCGHSDRGKQYDMYQAAAAALADKGFITLILDPIEQGERRQFDHVAESERPRLCAAHNIIGNQMALVGEFFGMWRVWDAIRGLDYLLARPETDRTRVGVTGNSGGGTLTTYVAALDPRPTMVAPSCYICSYGANLQNELPSDAEQNPPGILAAGLDQADLLLAFAPRPTLVLGAHDDFFDARYTRRAAAEMGRVHRLLGRRGTAACEIGPGGHGFSQANREAMLAFFMRHAGLAGESRERPFTPRPDAALWAAPGGSVLAAGSRRIQEMIRDEAAAWRLRRPALGEAALIRAAARRLGVRRKDRPPHYRLLSGASGEAGEFRIYSQFAVETEAGCLALVTVCSPGGSAAHPPAGTSVAYIGHLGGLDDLAAFPNVVALARGPAPFLILDPRGIGEVRDKSCGRDGFLEPYGSDFLYASTEIMLGRSLLGRRVHDVLRCLDFLQAAGAPVGRLVGRGIGSLTAVFAALLHPSRPEVRLLDYLPSFEDLVQDDLPRWPLSSLLPGGLRDFDLPDLYRVLGDRLTLGQPWDPRLTPRSEPSKPVPGA